MSRLPLATLPTFAEAARSENLRAVLAAEYPRGIDLAYAMADHAWNAIDSHVYGFTLQKLNFPFKPEEYAAQARGFLPHLPPDRYPYLRGMSEQVIDGHHDGMHDFEFGLDLILRGLESLRESTSAGSGCRGAG